MTEKTFSRCIGFISLWVLVLLLLAAPTLQAASWSVDGSDPACDDATGTPFCGIQAAIDAASDGDDVSIASGDYNDEIRIDRDLTLFGAGKSAVAGACDGITNLIWGGTVVTVEPGARAELSDVTIKWGVAAFGGGVNNSGELLLRDAEVCLNVTSLYGGGIYTEGAIDLLRVEVYDNSSLTTQTIGGGIYVATGGAATVKDSRVDENYANLGAGIGVAAGGTLNLNRSKLYFNRAIGAGSGIDAWGAGLHNLGTAFIRETELELNVVTDSMGRGGAIYNEGQLYVVRSAIVSNAIERDDPNVFGPALGAGIFNLGTAVLAGSTVSGNGIYNELFHFGYGAGIFNDGTLSLSSVTITNNTNAGAGWFMGAGVYSDGGTVTVGNSLIVAQANGQDCSGAITTAGHNIDSDSSCSLDVLLGDQPGVADPGLLPLADNGGPTPTHNLEEDSVAIDAGDPSGCLADLDGDGVGDAAIPDQRGNIWVDVPNLGNNAPDTTCDVGAVEFHLLANGTMEHDDDGDGIPDDWTGTGLAATDRQVCRASFAHEGGCFFRMDGDNSSTKQLVQELERAGDAGDSYALTVYNAARSSVGPARVLVQVDNLGGIGIEEEFELQLDNGTYGYQENSLDFTTAVNGYDVIRVIVESGTGGNLVIDDLSLVPHP